MLQNPHAGRIMTESKVPQCREARCKPGIKNNPSVSTQLHGKLFWFKYSLASDIVRYRRQIRSYHTHTIYYCISCYLYGAHYEPFQGPRNGPFAGALVSMLRQAPTSLAYDHHRLGERRSASTYAYFYLMSIDNCNWTP